MLHVNNGFTAWIQNSDIVWPAVDSRHPSSICLVCTKLQWSISMRSWTRVEKEHLAYFQALFQLHLVLFTISPVSPVRKFLSKMTLWATAKDSFSTLEPQHLPLQKLWLQSSSQAPNPFNSQGFDNMGNSCFPFKVKYSLGHEPSKIHTTVL